MPKKRVVLEFKVQMVYEVEADRTIEDVDAFFNEGSFCLTNLLHDLNDDEIRHGSNGCFLCHRAEVSCLREATPEDVRTMTERLTPHPLPIPHAQ